MVRAVSAIEFIIKLAIMPGIIIAIIVATIIIEIVEIFITL